MCRVPAPRPAPPGCGRLTVKTPTRAITPRAVPHPGPLSSQPAPCPPAGLLAQLLLWPLPRAASGRPLPSASLFFLSLVLEESSLFRFSSLPAWRACRPRGLERVLACVSPGEGRAGQGRGHPWVIQCQTGSRRGWMPQDARVRARAQPSAGTQHFPPSVPTQLQTQVCRPPREAAGHAAASQVHAHAHPCSPPARAHLRVQDLPGRGASPCSWFVGLWARWARARPKWLQLGSQ